MVMRLSGFGLVRMRNMISCYLGFELLISHRTNQLDGTDMSTITEKIPDDALVVRGGRNRPEDIRRGTGTHPSGVTGVSVESAAGVSVVELTGAIPHGQVGVTTVGEVRKAGGDVIRTSGKSPYHATLTGLTPEQASKLFTPTIPNPAREGGR